METRAAVRAAEAREGLDMTCSTLLASAVNVDVPYHQQHSDRVSETQNRESPGNSGRFRVDAPFVVALDADDLVEPGGLAALVEARAGEAQEAHKVTV